MSTKQNLEVHEGEDWKITFSARDEDGAIIALDSGVQCEFRISDKDGEVLTQSIGYGVTVTSAAQGDARIDVTVEEQEHHMILSTNNYNYEIRVFSDDFDSVQAEGELNIKSSLFTETPLDPLVFDFKVRFPEFTEADDVISLYLTDAKRVVDKNDVWDTDDGPVATVYLAAHLLQMRKNSSDQHLSGGMTGEVRAIRVEDRSVVFMPASTASLATKTGLNQTGYGQIYLNMLRRHPVFFKAM